MSPTSVTIVGAGPVGTLMALLLARRGHRVQLLERRSDPRRTHPERGRSINLALAARGIVALEQAGLMPRIAPSLTPMSGRMLHDEKGSLRFVRYGRDESEVIHSVSRERLTRLLIEAAAEQPLIDLAFDSRCLDVDARAQRLTVQSADGAVRELSFELLLGADGAGSAVREALVRRGETQAREEPFAQDYKELGIPREGRTPAFEPHALHIWPRGGFMLIALPNVDGSFTATLFLQRSGFEQLGQEAAVRSFFATQFPDAAPRIADLPHQFAAHPQGRLGTLYVQPWGVAGRVLLLGDAAHAIVPFHGQGLNCGFEDCRSLDRRLAESAQSAEAGALAAALAAFEAERRPNTAAIAAMSLENDLEMRDTVRSPRFATRRALAEQLERRFPERFVPRYSMVMFHAEIPYAEAQQRGERQERLLDALIERCGQGPLTREGLSIAQRLLDEQGL